MNTLRRTQRGFYYFFSHGGSFSKHDAAVSSACMTLMFFKVASLSDLIPMRPAVLLSHPRTKGSLGITLVPFSERTKKLGITELPANHGQTGHLFAYSFYITPYFIHLRKLI